MTDHEKPPGCRPGGSKDHRLAEEAKFPSNHLKRQAEFFLHVGPSGREWRLDFEPSNVRSLRVIVADGVERTRTRSIKFDLGAGLIEPRPRGADWVKVDDSCDLFTEWARPARPDEPLLSRQDWKNLDAWRAARGEDDE